LKLFILCFGNRNKFIKYFENKTIAVVGNAESIFEKNFGNDIDSHDIVVRFNKGYIKNENSQGRKTDIWASSLYIDEINLKKIFPDIKYVIWLSPKLSLIKKYSFKFFRKMTIYPLYKWYSLYNKIARNRPTSGAMLLDYLIKSTKYKKIDIYGFDFFKTNTFYNELKLEQLKSKTPHNFFDEKQYILSLIENYPDVTIKTKV
jgi:hypothetical protein